MMKWLIISEQYLAYLRTYEQRIPLSDYGKDRFKPFFGILFETDALYYVTQISSAKERHKSMKQNLDFLKLYDDKTNKLLAVVNLNYMFPVPKSEAIYLDYNKIQEHRDFHSEKQKSQYISFLKLELKLINQLSLSDAAQKLYQLKESYPEHFISKRCLDFKQLDDLAENYINTC